jgi:hypothetical protein
VQSIALLEAYNEALCPLIFLYLDCSILVTEAFIATCFSVHHTFIPTSPLSTKQLIKMTAVQTGLSQNGATTYYNVWYINTLSAADGEGLTNALIPVIDNDVQQVSQ